MPSPIESLESSSPIVTRAVAAGLRGKHTTNLVLPGWQKALLLCIGSLPQGVARFTISRFQSISGLPPQVLDQFSIDTLVQERMADYSELQGKFPAITIGAALGGATTYLSLALNAPFLPQTFVTTLKGGAPTGDVHMYLERTRQRALEIAARNPGIITIQHYDPIHDGWLTRWVNHLRFKLIDLPSPYIEFIRSRLAPRGSVIYLESQAQWLRYRLGPRSIFQVGGWGDIPAKEYLESSDRIRVYLSRAGLKSANWGLDENDFPLETGPESEWGSEPGLGEALEEFCGSEGYNFFRIRMPELNDFSRLAFSAARRLLEKEERHPAGVLVEMFSQFDTFSAFQAGLLPLWLIFNTRDSARFLKDMAPLIPRDKPIFFSPLSTFSLTPDIASWEEWRAALGSNFINIGARQSHYPADARALVRWNKPLRKWVEENLVPVTARLEPEELKRLWDNLESS